MRYRVAFAKRVMSDGSPSAEQPTSELDSLLADGVVAEKTFVEQIETDAQHGQEVLDEDDAFLGSATPEVWEYAVVDARAVEFEQAIQEADSELIMEWEVVDDTVTTEEEVSPVRLADGLYPADGESSEVETPVSGEGSGVRAGDDGPAGMPTGDPSAGGLGRSSSREVDVEDLSITSADDPRLGLTNHKGKPPQDWAANTGPSKNP